MNGRYHFGALIQYELLDKANRWKTECPCIRLNILEGLQSTTSCMIVFFGQACIILHEEVLPDVKTLDIMKNIVTALKTMKQNYIFKFSEAQTKDIGAVLIALKSQSQYGYLQTIN